MNDQKSCCPGIVKVRCVTIACAILDRILRHRAVINIRRVYRLKERNQFIR